MIFHLREKLHVGRDYRPPICALENERKRERGGGLIHEPWGEKGLPVLLKGLSVIDPCIFITDKDKGANDDSQHSMYHLLSRIREEV